MTIGERIKRERELHHLSQEQLAEQMEVSRQAVSKWETGQSRPSREKLERLSALFDLPMSVWTEEPPPSGQSQLKRWKLATSLLSIALCIALIGLLILWPKSPADAENISPSESSPVAEPSQDAQPTPPDTPSEPEAPPETPSVSHIFPETLALEAQLVDGFGSWPLAEADPDAMAVNPVVVFQERFPGSSWLQILRANPDVEEHAVFYDVFARSFRTLADAESEIIPLGRLAVRNHYVGSGLTGTETFTNVLGHDGWKISLSIGANYVAYWYFCVDPEDGRVYPLLEAAEVCAEYDVDEDGVKEIVASGGWSTWYIYDRLTDGSCVCYELKQNVYGVMRLAFSPEEGFTVSDDSGTVLVRYILRDGAMLRQQPLDFSAEDYPDAVGITLSFVTDPTRSDGRDPDAVLDNETTRTTHRQQAMLALQMLYDLTGWKPTECVCIANPDQISFYTAEDGGPGTLFYQWMPGKQYGGQGWVSGITLHWQEEYPDSPLIFSPTPIRLSAGHTPEEWVRSYALTLPLLCRGEIVYISKDPSGWPHHYALYRADGTYYSARLLDTETGFALAHFYGPYSAAGTT